MSGTPTWVGWGKMIQIFSASCFDKDYISCFLSLSFSQVTIAQYDCGIWTQRLASRKSHPTEKSLMRVYMTWHSIQLNHTQLALVLMVLLRCLCNHDYSAAMVTVATKTNLKVLWPGMKSECFDAQETLDSRFFNLVMLQQR